MSEADPLFVFDNTFACELDGMFEPWHVTPVESPTALLVNEQLAGELGVSAQALRSPHGVAVLSGSVVPDGAEPIAQAYSGHQFGNFSPRLGDGRALLLGEVIDGFGRRCDIHLKGSGRTPFARGGDGKAAVGPMLREYLIGESLHALGVPATRALAVVASGEQIARESWLPGAVLTRVAASHLRVGSFQYAATFGGADLLRRLVDYALRRHAPHCADSAEPALALLRHVVDVQARLIAAWMNIGFIHGVMNTDNVTISGETIDFGPCAFMDHFDPATVFSSIDHGGRYAYGNQPRIAQWNMARLAEALLSIIDDDADAAVASATEAVDTFVPVFNEVWLSGMRAKIGLVDQAASDRDLIDDLLATLAANRVDMTMFFRTLAGAARGADDNVTSMFADTPQIDAWLANWRERLGDHADGAAGRMNAVNPLYVPRNHLVEQALASATIDGDLTPCHLLLEVITRPFDERPGFEAYTEPMPADFGPFRTFCGT
jgi:uncharacterized protein YdiU (UPF0061 family)